MNKRSLEHTLGDFKYSMILNDQATWPNEILRYLRRHHDLFLTWELRRTDENRAPMNPELAHIMASQFDRAIYGLRELLRPYSLLGYHCTRLTDGEIDHIHSNGMQPPSAKMLSRRIQKLCDAGLLESAIADRLRQENQADENYRRGLIWFCFFPPHLAGQFGIERLLRSWGGEALYNSHERDSLTGPILKRIGTPCLIEADVPIASFQRYTSLENHLYRQFLVDRGHHTNERLEHEDCATCSISASHVRRVIRFTEPDFIELTNCDSWTPPLT
jgi:hypothetical protein